MIKKSTIMKTLLGVFTLAGVSGQQAVAQVYNAEPATIFWSMEDAENVEAPTTLAPEGAFSVASFDVNGNNLVSYDKVNWCDYKFAKIQPANGDTDVVKWDVIPAKGLTFTPTKISAYICKFGTDAAKEKTVVTGHTKEGKNIKLGVFTAARNNKTQDEDKFGKESSYRQSFEIILTDEQKAELASQEGFTLDITCGVANNKQCGFSQVLIEGVVDGEKVSVAKYPVTIAANPEDGGTVAIKPVSDVYEAGAEITLTATEKFGYDFVNWTNAEGAVVAETPEFKMTVNREEALTANFVAVPTYALDATVSEGANDYMVQMTPAPTVVDGRNMYEAGTNVTLKAISNPVVSFTNWSDGQTSSEISVKMDSDVEIKAEYAIADFIVGWDFWRQGSSGRPADFAFEENDAVTLNLRNDAGESASWLDKSQMAANGYEGRPAAVNWTTTGVGNYYWQTKFNASAFKNLKVITAMLYNYNAYSKQLVEYSLDGENWTTLGTISLTGAKKWTDAEFDFPAEANNQAEVYLRWISDRNSDKAGTTSNNDGIALGASFIVGEKELINDGTAPVLLSTVPAEGATTASTNGKIVLTFDEKVMIAEDAKATLGGMKLTGEAAGKTVVFTYKNLSFNTPYEFNLPGNVISDLTANYMTEPVKISFTTRTRPEVTKAAIDFIVPDDGDFRAAITAANNRTDKDVRYRILVKKGTYMIPMDPEHMVSVNGGTFPDVTLRLTASNTSIVGEDRDATIIINEVPDMDGTGSHPMEGIGNADLLQIQSGVTGTYIQDITLKHGISDNRGRNIVVQDKGDKTVYNNVVLWGYQDTWTSNNEKARYYFEGGVLRGRTDFLCGKGDAFFNASTLQMCGNGYLAVPSNPKQYGYIFSDCEITGESSSLDGNYTLGRPWGEGTPIALFINTRMMVKPSAIGWSDMGTDGHPKRFAEYNSTTASGTVIDLADRKKTFGSGKHANNPVLTKEEADFHSYSRVMGGDDDWDPALDCEKAPAATQIIADINGIHWNADPYTLCWIVYVDGEIAGVTTEPAFAIADAANKTIGVRAVNEMGGLGEMITDVTTGIKGVDTESAGKVRYFNLQGIEVVPGNEAQVLIKVTTLSDGTKKAEKVVK